MDNMLAPIAIFAFNRTDALQRMLDSLAKNPGFDDSRITVFVDGPRNDAERAKTDAVAAVARKYTDDVRVSSVNKGLAPSIIGGVTEIVNQHGKVIVLEDDLVLAPGFLGYMNDALERYKDDKRVISVCGYGLKIKRPADYAGDVYLMNRSSSWGWGIWADRWNEVDWEVSDYDTFKTDKKARASFNRGGSDMSSMLDGYMEGKNRSWAIRFCYWQWRKGMYSVHPFRSLVANEGYGADATNCRQKYSRFKIDFDDTGGSLVLPEYLTPDNGIISQSRRYHSIYLRIYSRLRKMIGV